jgi:hypothetical protein
MTHLQMQTSAFHALTSTKFRVNTRGVWQTEKQGHELYAGFFVLGKALAAVREEAYISM